MIRLLIIMININIIKTNKDLMNINPLLEHAINSLIIPYVENIYITIFKISRLTNCVNFNIIIDERDDPNDILYTMVYSIFQKETIKNFITSLILQKYKSQVIPLTKFRFTKIPYSNKFFTRLNQLREKHS